VNNRSSASMRTTVGKDSNASRNGAKDTQGSSTTNGDHSANGQRYVTSRNSASQLQLS
jgi:hypothetical protein